MVACARTPEQPPATSVPVHAATKTAPATVPEIRAQRGVVSFDLDAAIEPATNAPAFVYRGQAGVAPTIRASPGDELRVRLHNHLPAGTDAPNEVNLHFHGLSVSPNAPSDDAMRLARPGETIAYDVRIPRARPPGLYWYHPHAHGQTYWQITSGMSGALIVEGLQRHLPALAGLRERVIVLSAADAARINLGNVLRLEGRYSDALDTFRQLLDSYRRAGDRDGEGRALIGIGTTLLFAGQPGASDAFLEALRLFRSVGNLDGEADALKNLGLLDINGAHYDDALRYHQESLALYRAANDRAGEARALHNIGIVQRSLYQYSEALQSFQKALAAYRSLGDRDGEVTIVGSIGVVQFELGRYDEAVDSLGGAAALADKLGDRFLSANATTEMARVEEREGRYADALTASHSAMATFREIKADNFEALPLSVEGLVEERQHRYADSLSSLERARTLFQKLGSREEEALETLVNIAAVESATGHDAEALRLLNDVRLGSAAVGNRMTGALATAEIGIIDMRRSQLERALTLEQEALNVFRSVHDPYDEAGALVNLGDVFSRQGHYAKALDSYEGALKIYRTIGASAGEKETLSRIARTRPFVVLLTR